MLSCLRIGDKNFLQNNVENWYNPTVDPPEMRIIAISAGGWHSVGLRANGDVVSTSPEFDTDAAWKKAHISKVNLGAASSWKNIVAISAGTGYTLALLENGEVFSCG